ncbi:MAG: 30S ribosomal protein S2, partial [Parcubacteria group bacterium]|nr:30S ribosomal protein S2 [Parcubacteria group bacterium]
DLEKTCAHLAAALEEVKGYAARGKAILFVGTKPEARVAVEETATALNMPFVTHRWIGGTLTNFSEIRKRVERLKSLTAQKERGELSVYSKKERRDMEDEVARLTRNFSGVVGLDRIPDALFIVDPRHEDTAVREALKIGVPLIALANSDCNLKEIRHPILANDVSRSSITFFLDKVREAYKEGIAARALAVKEKEAEDVREAKNEDGVKIVA